jgi:hypothetical protein
MGVQQSLPSGFLLTTVEKVAQMRRLPLRVKMARDSSP